MGKAGRRKEKEQRKMTGRLGNLIIMQQQLETVTGITCRGVSDMMRSVTDTQKDMEICTKRDWPGKFAHKKTNNEAGLRE